MTYTRKRWIRGALALAVLAAAAPIRAANAQDLFNNTNGYAVMNQPLAATTFSLASSARITQVQTYHWNSGRGAPGGLISLRHSSGQLYGPFQAVASAGYANAPNVNWLATLNVTVPAGTYTVIDSDPATWSHNVQSGSRGFAIVRGSLVVSTLPIPLPGPVRPPLIPLPPAAPVCPASYPVSYIRGLAYTDYSAYTTRSPAAVPLGGFFTITASCPLLNPLGPIVVTLQDVNRGNGFGVTVFQLTNVFVSGNVIVAQVPTQALFAGRTYHVAVFNYGSLPYKTANPGTISIF